MAKPGGSENPGERKLLTVLFADLRGSFALISGRDPEQADEFLSAVTGEMQAAVIRHGGTVTRVMGDGIMAVFGAPQADEHHAARACMAALDMRRTVTGGSAARTHVPDAPISIRIGLNSGEAVIRRVDSDSFAGYEVNGESVHLAARMEQNAPANAILVAEDSARLVAAHFNLRAVQVGEVKGLANPIAVFELLSERSGAARPRALRAGPFVSRAQEARVVTAARQAAAGGRGQLVLIRGEAGLGKSRLVDETILRRAEPGLVAYAQGRPFRRRGYQLAADLVASGLGLDVANPRVVDPADLLAKLEAFDAGALFTPLAVVLGSAATQPDWVALTPTQRRDRMQAAVADLIARIAARRPLVVVVEDLQWIDPESQEALDRIVSRLPDLALLLVVTGRPEWRCPWRPAEWLQELHLSPLSELALRNLLATRLAGNHAAHLSRVLAQRAGGNPLFAELMLSGLVDDGVLLDLGANFHVLREASVGQLPPTIRGLLSERVDRLPANEKRALQAAAVIGPRVPAALLAQVTGMEAEPLRVVTDRLQTAGFLEAAIGPAGVLAFRHELMREAVYADLLLRTRREIHGRVVDAMQASIGDSPSQPVEEIAEHALHAARWKEAARYASLAAQNALARDAHVEAAYFLRSAIASVEHWPHDTERTALALSLHLAIRDPLFRLGRIDELASHLAQAALLIDDDTDWRKRGLFHVQSSHVSSLRGDSDTALAECAKALALAQVHGDAALAARASFQQGLELFNRWELVPAAATLDAAWQYISVHPTDTSYGLQHGFDVATLSYATRARAELGHFAEAESAVTLLLELSEARNRAFETFFACMAIGHLHEARDQPRTAAGWLEKAEASCRAGDMPLLAMVAATHLGRVMVQSGDIRDGLVKLQATHSQINTMGFRGQLAFCLASLAEGYLLNRDLIAAHSAAEQAIAAASIQNDAGAQIQASLVLAECLHLHRGGEPEGEPRLLAEALAMAERLSLRPLAQRCRLRLGRLSAPA